jgi:hypothetical protein
VDTEEVEADTEAAAVDTEAVDMEAAAEVKYMIFLKKS